ncbi:MAG: efflux RND transporter periplasmic adaptor subunit [Rhodospirillaceae bacterium]|nr:efflux RND transporter periplasmic adaptor subunit [Rhodospirillaceae bacterium]
MKQLLIVAALCALGYLAYAYGWPLVYSADSRQAAEQDAAKPPVQVLVHQVELRPERTRIEAVGTGEATLSATLFPATAGEVVGIGIAPNRKVAEGDLLLELNRRAEELAVDLAKVQLRRARQLLQRYESTGNSGVVPASTIDDARSAVEEARIALRQAEVDLTDRMVIAPFAGHVGMTEVEIGDRIGPDTAITTLDDRSTLLVSFAIPEIFLERVATGQSVSVSTWAARDRPYPGQIVELGSRIDPVSRSFMARARVPNQDDRLRPGMSFAIAFELLGNSYPLVPEAAVQWGGDGAYLWVLRDGKAERETVRIVQRQEGTVLVDAAVAAGEAVVVEGIQRMRPGLAVTAAEPTS